jgi:hypothetical protein
MDKSVKEVLNMALRVLVSGAGGKMGREVSKAVHGAKDMELVGAVDPGYVVEELTPQPAKPKPEREVLVWRPFPRI